MMKTNFFKNNAADILTGVGIGGAILTLVTAIKATHDALIYYNNEVVAEKEEVTVKETVKAIAPYYILPVACCVGTIGCIVGSNTANKKDQAVLMSALLLGERKLIEYKNKCKDVLGEEKTKEIEKDIIKDRIANLVPEEPSVDGNKHLFYEDFTGRMFKTTMENVEMAELKLRQHFEEYGEASLNDYFRFLGLSETYMGETFTWTDNDLCVYGVEPSDLLGVEYYDFYEIPGTDILSDTLITAIVFPWSPTVNYE